MCNLYADSRPLYSIVPKFNTQMTLKNSVMLAAAILAIGAATLCEGTCLSLVNYGNIYNLYRDLKQLQPL